MDEQTCARCGYDGGTTPGHVDPATGTVRVDYWLCGLCPLDELRRGLTATPAFGGDAGYAGLPDPAALPSVGQITDLNQPSDTELTDGFP